MLACDTCRQRINNNPSEYPFLFSKYTALHSATGTREMTATKFFIHPHTSTINDYNIDHRLIPVLFLSSNEIQENFFLRPSININTRINKQRIFPGCASSGSFSSPVVSSPSCSGEYILISVLFAAFLCVPLFMCDSCHGHAASFFVRI